MCPYMWPFPCVSGASKGHLLRPRRPAGTLPLPEGLQDEPGSHMLHLSYTLHLRYSVAIHLNVIIVGG